MLYAEVLVIHAETRQALFSRVEAAAKRVVVAEGAIDEIAFDLWFLHVAGTPIPLWPWHVTSVEQLPPNAMRYTATLKARSPRPEDYWSFTVMPVGNERVFVPASALIAINSLSREPEARTMLAILLLHVNRYYQSVGGFPLASYAKALGSGLAALRESGKR
jgi:hypothetical protein